MQIVSALANTSAKILTAKVHNLDRDQFLSHAPARLKRPLFVMLVTSFSSSDSVGNVLLRFACPEA